MSDYSSHIGAQHFVQRLKAFGLDRPGAKGLVVGFGEGHEADYLQRNTQTEIVGIDVLSRIKDRRKTIFRPFLASAMNVPFKATSFDFVFYHHVIEHVPDPNVTLAEINRVLIPGGILYIGTPNRHRIIGYMGAYQISLRRKIRNNLLDYINRLLGRFRNELGAHAGFSKREMAGMLAPFFTDLEWLTEEYLIYKYRNRLPAPILKFLQNPSVLEVAAPSIYVLCRKPYVSTRS